MPTDFGSYPPEVNSLRMYTGPGPGPLLAAAQAWDAVADEMYTAASGFQSTVSELTATAWSGPSSEAMGAAAERHIRWLGSTAAHAEHTAAQARIAAAAFEAAFVSTVPPPEVAANRSLLAMLVATNFLGVNTPAIAATEALYAEMWAQDALAMYTYAGSSAAAVALPSFESADGIAGDLDSPISLVPQALSALAAPAQGELLSPLASLIAIFINSPGDFAAIFVLAPVDALTGFAEVPPAAFTTLSGLEDDESFSHNNGEQAWPGEGPAPLLPFPPTLSNPPAGVLTAALGEANVVGTLSVPPSWPVDAAEVRPVALATPLTAGTALEVEAAMVGQAMTGPVPPVVEQAAASMPQRTGCAKAPRPVVTGVVAAIREIARQRAEGLLSDAEYDERKTEVLDGAMDARASELVRVERATGIEPA